MKKIPSLILLAGSLALMPRMVLAADLVCEPPVVRAEGMGWCSDPSHFMGGFCIAEPIGRNRAVSSDPSETVEMEELNRDSVCLLGKIDVSELENLVDFTASLDFLPSNQFEALLEVDAGFFAPDIDLIRGEGDSSSRGQFQTDFLLSRQGQYNLRVQASFIRDEVVVPVTSIKRVTRVSAPHLTVTDVRGKRGEATFGGFAVSEQPVEGGEGGGEGGGGGASPAHSVGVAPPADSLGMDSVDLCLASDLPDASHPNYPGSDLDFAATNRITDPSGDVPREMIIRCSPGNGVCDLAQDASFCPGGNVLNIPMGHGTNEIEVTVNNVVTGDLLESGERIIIAPIENDLKGPTLCVRYLDAAGQPIADAAENEGRVLLAGEAEVVDVTLGACDQTPETVEAQDSCAAPPGVPPPCAEDSPNPRVCIALQNGGFQAMCPVAGEDGNVHYQAVLGLSRFPINTITIQAFDEAGNQIVETRSFLFGEVRPLFGAGGQLDLQGAMVPKGVGGFITNDYLTRELKPILLKVLNSDKFKNEMFPKLLDPRRPGQAEQECLKDLEGQFPTTFDHLGDFSHMGDAQRVVAIKLFCDNGQCGDIGEIEIPSLYLLRDNRLWLQLKINGLHGRAEMYTMEFTNSDEGLPGGDDLVDTEDDDDDADGILDQDDPDDDNDEVPDERDLPGRLVEDPDYGTFILPIRFQVRELAVNLELALEKDADGRLVTNISNVPGRDLVQAIPDGDFLIDFDCDKDISEIYQGGRSEDPGNGRNLWIDTEACHSLKSMNKILKEMKDTCANECSWGDPLACLACGEQWFAENGLAIDLGERRFQGTNDQFKYTFEATLRCSTPKRLEAQLEKFETEKVMAVSQELLDKKFHFDFFSPLGKSDLSIDPVGIGFSGGGALLSAGVTSPDDETERDANEFLEGLPAEFHSQKFGPVFQEEAPEGDRVDPVEASYGMGSEIALALKEETVNSLLHAVNVTLFDLDRQEGDDLKTLDLFAKRLREEFGMGISDVGGTICRDQDNQRLDDYQEDEQSHQETGNGGLDANWKCFPFPLSLNVLLGDTTLRYIDFDGNHVVEPEKDSLIPVLLRTTLDSFAAPTVRLVNVSALEGWDGRRASRPRIIMAEMEIGLPPTQMAVYEEQWVETSFINPNNGTTETVKRGTGVIKSWCDSEGRFPGMDPARCAASPARNSPIAVFSATGRIFLTLLIERGDNGILRIAAGISSVGTQSGPVLDTDKSYLKVSTVENNTLVSDKVLADTFEGNLNTILGKFLFGSQRTIKMKVPAIVPLADFCKRFRRNGIDEIKEVCDCVVDPEGEDCDQIAAIEDLWNDLDLDEDFGIHGFELQDPLIGLSGSGVYSEDPAEAVESLMGGPRYLTVGIGTCIKGEDGACIGD